MGSKTAAKAKQDFGKTMQQKMAELEERRKKIALGGGEAAHAKRREKGMLSARERIKLLVDEGTFQEIYRYAEHRCTDFGMAGKEMPGDGVVTGVGQIDGRIAAVASQDFTVSAERKMLSIMSG